VACGHGMPMSGEQMQHDLMELAQNFEQKAMPSHGRYVSEPAVTNRYGVVSLPEPKSQLFSKIALIGAIAAIAAIGIAVVSAKKIKKSRF